MKQALVLKEFFLETSYQVIFIFQSNINQIQEVRLKIDDQGIIEIDPISTITDDPRIKIYDTQIQKYMTVSLFLLEDPVDEGDKMTTKLHIRNFNWQLDKWTEQDKLPMTIKY